MSQIGGRAVRVWRYHSAHSACWINDEPKTRDAYDVFSAIGILFCQPQF